jgi:ABC-2 type transport system ATP-binding protein
VLAVDDVSFEVRAGSCFGLLGPNGAGKTTTVEIMEGVTPATSGEVYYFGRPAGNKFREEAGIQFQNTALQDYLTVRESLQMFQSLYNRHADLNKPRLVFLDEPTTGLDPQARRNFWDLVNRIRSDGTTIILTTHYMDEAQILCDEIAIMDFGKIIIQGGPAELLRQRYQNVIIELPLDDVSGDLQSIDHRILESQGVIEISTDDVNSSLQALATHVSGLNRLKIRQPNLEDLFLDLTGHSLRA